MSPRSLSKKDGHRYSSPSNLLLRWIPLTLAFIAPLAVLVLVRLFVVDVPFLDEWQWAPMIEHVRLGQLTWSDIWPLHSEQRIVVPSLAAAAFAAVRHNWVITRETTFSVSLLFATLAVWWLVIVRLVPVGRREWALALIALLASSLTQAENWTWGFQMSFFIANLSAAIIMLSFVMADRRWSLPVGLIALIVAANSIGLGLTATLAGMVFYAITRERWKFVAWTVVSMILIALYVHDFQASLYRPVEAAPLSRLFLTVNFALTVAGAPIARGAGTRWCALVGLLATIAIAVYGVFVLRRKQSRVGSVALLALGLMPIVGALEVAYGRLFEGLDAALGGRFTTSMSLLWITLVLIGARVDTRRLRIVAVSGIPLALLWIASQVGGYREFREHSLALFAAAQVIPRWNTATEDEFPTLWPAEVFLDSLHTLGEGPFLNP